MEVPLEILSNLLLTLGEVKGALSEIRQQNERISQLEKWQTRQKIACTALVAWCASLCRGIYGR